MINKARKLSTKFRQKVNWFSPRQTLQEAISQKHCYLCDKSVFNKLPICEGCRKDLPFNRTCCDTCAIPLPALENDSVGQTTIHSNKRICGECLNLNPSYTQCFSAFCYTFPANALISDFKYKSKRHLGKLLSSISAQIIKTKIEESTLRRPDKLIPVPLHIDRFSTRGFNQSEDICKDLSRHLNIPIDITCIQRTANMPAQASLTKRQRQQNLSSAFCILKELNGETVALVDDVITTGVTAELLSSLLLKAGAKEVYVWSLARTPLKTIL